MIITRTPFRISFFGGGTDYPAWYRNHGGAVLATTIDKYCYLSCRYLPPFFEHRIRLVYSKIENCQSVDEISHPAVREVFSHLGFDRGVEVHHDGDLPARSGMGSSSAFTVGLLHATSALMGRMLDKHQIAAESIHIEQERLRETVGSQDQVLAAYGGFNHVTFHQNGDFSVRPVTIPQERVQELNANLMLFYTGIRRTASDVAQTYVNDLEARARQLRLFGLMVDEGLAILNDGAGLERFGELLHEAWQVKRTLSQSISSPEIEEIYEAARSAGAIGGKVLGAGGGGFVMLYVPRSRQEKVRDVLRTLIHVPFKFEHAGSHVIFFDPEQDYAALDRARMNHTSREAGSLLMPER